MQLDVLTWRIDVRERPGLESARGYKTTSALSAKRTPPGIARILTDPSREMANISVSRLFIRGEIRTPRFQFRCSSQFFLLFLFFCFSSVLFRSRNRLPSIGKIRELIETVVCRRRECLISDSRYSRKPLFFLRFFKINIRLSCFS